MEKSSHGSGSGSSGLDNERLRRRLSGERQFVGNGRAPGKVHCPEYTGDAANWDDYRVVYLGYPIWWGEAPAIVYTFTEHHSFEGKTVIPFATSYSSPLGDSGENLARAAKTGTWLPGECFTGGGKTDDVLRWIHSLKK